jgi:hypothetical protein
LKIAAVFVGAVLAFVVVYVVMGESARATSIGSFVPLALSIVVWGVGTAYWITRSPESRWRKAAVSVLALIAIVVVDLFVAFIVACGLMGSCP